MERDELAAWLRLTMSEGVGTQVGARLLATFGLPQAIFAQSADALEQVVSHHQTQALLAEPKGWALQLEHTWAWLHSPELPGVQRRVVPLGDVWYPPDLLAIEDPPLLLYLMGQLELDAARWPTPQASAYGHCIAIVGSRNPTPQGQANARQFSRACAQAGLTIVSGLALGVDGAAHEGALDAAPEAPWATVAVMGTGLDRVYPRKHLELAHRISRRGLLVSEYPLGTPPLAANFPRRNRIISGLSLATLVVEAALRSGSLITARLAAEQGKDVFAIPGSIHAPLSRGCHALIKQGAQLVESAQDVLESLSFSAPATVTHTGRAASHGAHAHPLLEALGHDPVGLDALTARTGIDAAGLQVQLLELELSGEVARLPGGLFQRQANS
jgi:DNA processing protein